MTDDPVLIAYAVKHGARSKRPVWARIDKAYPHEQGAGLTMILDAAPPDGRIVLLERDDDNDARLLREASLFRGRLRAQSRSSALEHPSPCECPMLHQCSLEAS